MANRNTKSIRRMLLKAKKDITVEIPKTMPGGSLAKRTQNLSFGYQARLSKKPKVAAGKGRRFVASDE